MGLSSIMSLLLSLETAMMIPHAAAAPLPLLLFRAVHLYTLGLHLFGGELNLCSSASSSCSSIPQRWFPLPQQSLSLWGEAAASDQDCERSRKVKGRFFDTGARGPGGVIFHIRTGSLMKPLGSWRNAQK